MDPAFSRAARAAWARLIQKVYEIDPLLCPHCGAEMRLIAQSEDAPVIEKILKHLNRWDPRPRKTATGPTTVTIPPGAELLATSL